MKYANLLDRFITYVKVNTRSDENSTTTPSTQSQVDFATNVLIPEMKRVGLQNVYYLPNGYSIGTLPANDPSFTRKIGFISHMDTADFNAENVNPQIVENYDGGVIALGDSGFTLDPADFAHLNNYKGQTLITTDGTTLLGADDKSGIAEDFDVDFAYTIDGGPLGELQFETFSAAAADITFQGRNVHPGTAKGQMINALQLAIDFHNKLPEGARPELTEGYEGFYHLMNIDGTVEEASASYIIRDFETESFEKRKDLMKSIADQMNAELGSERVLLTLKDQYYNMKQVIEKDMTPITLAKEVMEDLGITPIIEPIRGGTDGSKISFMGIPTPNIFAGGENMHGRFEYVSLQTMERAVDTIIGIVTKK